MDDSSPPQRFRINAMHGHDIGVWVCEGSGLSLSPCLLMQAVHPEPAPRPLLAKWQSAGSLPKAFRPAGTLPVIYSEGGRLPPWPYHLHLFAPQAPVAQALEETSGLQDWSFRVPVLGIIIIFDRKHDGVPITLSLTQLLNRSPSSKPNRTLAWVQAQNVPYVVSALGYDDAPTSAQQFRNRYDLAADVPVVPGPALADARQRSRTDGMFSSMFERQKLAMDRDYARVVLDVLFRLIEKKR